MCCGPGAPIAATRASGPRPMRANMRTQAAIQHLNSCSVKTVMPCRPLLPDVAKTWYAPR